MADSASNNAITSMLRHNARNGGSDNIIAASQTTSSTSASNRIRVGKAFVSPSTANAATTNRAVITDTLAMTCSTGLRTNRQRLLDRPEARRLPTHRL